MSGKRTGDYRRLHKLATGLQLREHKGGPMDRRAFVAITLEGVDLYLPGIVGVRE